MLKKIIGSFALVTLVLYAALSVFVLFYDVYKVVGWWTIITTPALLITIATFIIALLVMSQWVTED